MAYQNQHLSQELPIQHFTDQTNNNNSFRSILPDSPDPNSKPDSDPNNQLQTTPNWLNNAILRTHYTDNTNNVNDTNGNGASNFLNPQQTSTGQWLHRETMAGEVEHDGDGLGGKSEVAVVGDGGGGLVNWQTGRWKAEIMAHPLYEQLLSAHVACLRIATPVDQLPRIDAQLAQSQNVVAKYSAFGQNIGGGVDDKELDHFMVYSFSASNFFAIFLILSFPIISFKFHHFLQKKKTLFFCCGFGLITIFNF